jgi:hypothetical protein
MADLAFLLQAKTTNYADDEPVLRLRATVVHVTDDGIRNLTYNTVDRSGLADLTVTALGEPNIDDAYAWQVGYHRPYSVDLDRVRMMVATLGRVERRLVQLSGQFGRPESFGAYLLRVATVLRVRRFVVWTRESQGLRAPREYRVMDGQVAVTWLEAREREFHATHPAAASAPA